MGFDFETDVLLLFLHTPNFPNGIILRETDV